MGDMGKAYRILFRKSEGKRYLEEPSYFKGSVWMGVGKSEVDLLAQNSYQSLVNTVINLRIQ
jgi:hypothetical protein